MIQFDEYFSNGLKPPTRYESRVIDDSHVIFCVFVMIIDRNQEIQELVGN